MGISLSDGGRRFMREDPGRGGWLGGLGPSGEENPGPCSSASPGGQQPPGPCRTRLGPEALTSPTAFVPATVQCSRDGHFVLAVSRETALAHRVTLATVRLAYAPARCPPAQETE